VSLARGWVEVIRAPQVKDHGALYFDWENPDPARRIEGCIVTAGPSSENNDRQDAELVLYTIQAPWGADVRTTDKVRVYLEPGLDLAVEGRPRPVPSPTGNLSHTLIELRSWEVA
jgi:hypothetical protein